MSRFSTQPQLLRVDDNTAAQLSPEQNQVVESEEKPDPKQTQLQEFVPQLQQTQFQPLPLAHLGFVQPNQYLYWQPNFVYTAPQLTLPQYAVLPNTAPVGVNNITSTETATTTEVAEMVKGKEREPTTARPTVNRDALRVEPLKLQLAQTQPQAVVVDEADFRSDARLLAAIRKINPEFVIEDIILVPGKHVISTTSAKKLNKATLVKLPNRLLSSASATHNRRVIEQQNAPQHVQTAQATELQQSTQFQQIPQKKTAAKLKKSKPVAVNSNVKVEATGKTSTTGTIPQIPFQTYFLPYFSRGIIGDDGMPGKKVAALILEPHSKAVVGNGGTAISTPISKAYLKRGVPTNVYFNPESVAIAGVGGKAHAQADLILDLISGRS